MPLLFSEDKTNELGFPSIYIDVTIDSLEYFTASSVEHLFLKAYL